MPTQFEAWTCGYANLGAMLRNVALAGRVDLMSDVARGGVCQPTDVAALQEMMEQAWWAGFDPATAQLRRHQMVGRHGHDGFLDVAEVVAVLWWLRLNYSVIEILGGGAASPGPQAGEAVYTAVATIMLPTGGGAGPYGVVAPILVTPSHWRMAIGVAPAIQNAPRAIVVRDPRDGPGLFRRVPLTDLDGKDTHILFLSTVERVTESASESGMGGCSIVAKWRDGVWLDGN